MSAQRFRKKYKAVSLTLSILFAAVGLIFLLMPADVLVFFNNISRIYGMEATPVQGFSLYLILAVGYMYLVSLLSAMMYLHPDNKYFIWLLINGKSASAVLSLLLFIFHRPFLIFAANALIDGAIAAFLAVLYKTLKAETA